MLHDVNIPIRAKYPFLFSFQLHFVRFLIMIDDKTKIWMTHKSFYSTNHIWLASRRCIVFSLLGTNFENNFNAGLHFLLE